MLTFIHAADIHLDSPLHGLGTRADAPVDEIRGATRRALSNLVELAIEENVDFLLIAGDLYDGDWKDYGTGLTFVREMRRLDEKGIAVYLISGNHDAESKTTKKLQLPDNVHVFPTRKPGSIDHSELPVTLHGQGFSHPSVTDDLSANYPEPAKDRFNIGLLHTSLAGDPEHDNYAPADLKSLVAKGYDYWALGHIHLRELKHEFPHVAYSGNPQGRHIKESGPKGCYLVKVDADLKLTDFEFRALDAVRWELISIDTSDLETQGELLGGIRQNLQNAFESTEGRLLATRIVLTGSCAFHQEILANPQALEAECLSIAQGIDPELIWIERVAVKTRSRVDLQELAKRDDLTAMVLESLEKFEPDPTLPAIAALHSKLAPEAIDSLKTSPSEMRDEVAAIVLQALETSH